LIRLDLFKTDRDYLLFLLIKLFSTIQNTRFYIIIFFTLLKLASTLTVKSTLETFFLLDALVLSVVGLVVVAVVTVLAVVVVAVAVAAVEIRLSGLINTLDG
jgi:hypothetical protein